MDIDCRDTCYEIYRSKDARYDGRFFVGITTTGIYCRPVCTARLPKPENCRYFRTAAEAEKAGFRPCLLCHPELAPGASRVDASSELAGKAVYYLRDNCDTGASLEELSGELGCSERHLRRVFQEEYRVTPVEYLQTCRLLLAKQILTETPLTVLETAMTAGFGSVRRMNELFQKHYGMTPSDVRRKSGSPDAGHTMGVSLGYRTPYAWKEMLAFLMPRAIPRVERVTAFSYERVLRLMTPRGKACSGIVRVTQEEGKRALRVEMSETLVPVMPRVLAGVRQMFDLDCDPLRIDEKLAGMRQFLPGGIVPGIRVPGCFDAFETACRAIVGQQISVRAASTLCGRLAEKYGTPVETGMSDLSRTFPDAQTLAAMGGEIAEQLGKLGISSAKSGAIRSLAVALLKEDGLKLSRAADPETEIKKLRAIRGIGSWTAEYIAMRTMGWTDAFLETDAGVRSVLPAKSGSERQKLSEAWKPWRSYAMMNLWNQYGKRAPAKRVSARQLPAKPVSEKQVPAKRLPEGKGGETLQKIRYYQSPLGKILLTADDQGLTGLWFEGAEYAPEFPAGEYEERSAPVLEAAGKWLDLYFSGRDPGPFHPLHLIGTEFQKEVWKILLTIPYGKTMTYGEIAEQIAKEKGLRHMSAQAVGGAVGHNHVSIIIPCHRVIGTDGSLTGYAGGLEKKKFLLKLEHAR